MARCHSELEGVRAISPETKQAAGGRRLWSLCGRLLQPRLSVRHRDFVIDLGRHAEFTPSVRAGHLSPTRPASATRNTCVRCCWRPPARPAFYLFDRPVMAESAQTRRSAIKIITTMMAGAVVAHLSWMQPAQAQGAGFISPDMYRCSRPGRRSRRNLPDG